MKNDGLYKEGEKKQTITQVHRHREVTDAGRHTNTNPQAQTQRRSQTGKHTDPNAKITKKNKEYKYKEYKDSHRHW